MDSARSGRAGSWLALTTAALLAACGGGGSQEPSAHGSLVIQVTGLPGGAVPRLVVSGPGSEVRLLFAAGELTGLAPGSYTVSGLHVPAGGLDYTAVATPSTLSVGDAADTVQVVYTGGPPPTRNFRIGGIQLFQSVQNDANTVPMVANRAAVLRVFALSNQTVTAALKVRVHLYQGATLIDSITVTGPTVIPTAIDTASFTASWNATIPTSRMVAGMQFDAVVDPDDIWPEASETDNRFPAGTARVAPAVLTVPAVRLRLVPVRFQVNNTVGNVTSANHTNYSDLISRIYPISSLTVDVRAPFTTAAPVLESNDDNGSWGRVLGEINALRASEGGDRYYYGVVPTTYNSGIAGLGYVGLPAAIGWDKGSGVGGVAAHEIGHNFGRQHAPCGDPGSPDANYPYPGAVIGVWGFDQKTSTLKAPLAYTDLMSYCSPNWVSDYTYLGVFDFLTGSALVQAPAPAPGLLVWGRIVGDSMVLEPAFQVTAPALLPNAPGPYRVTGLASDGSTAFDLSFAGTEVPDLPGKLQRHFAFVVPISGARVAGLATIRASGPRGRAVRSVVASGDSDVEVQPAGAGQISLRWNSRYPMALVRDAASGEILAFARGGSATIAAPAGVKVELSRGTTSVTAVVRGRK